MRFLLDIRQIVWCAAVVACSDSREQAVRPVVETSDSAGVELVRNLDKSVDTLAMQLEEALRIGVVDGAEDYQFHLIGGVAVDPLGRLFVIDQGTQAVRLFDRDGRLVRKFGGRGKGPGEFERIGALFLWRDTVHVANSARAPVSTFFDTTGSLLATRTSLLPDGSGVMPLAGGPSGWIFGDDSLFARKHEEKAGDVTHYSMELKHGNLRDMLKPGLTRAGADSALSRIAIYKTGRIFWHIGSEGGNERFVLGNDPFFEPSGARAIDDRGFIYISHGWPYLVDVFNAGGQIVRRISRAHDSIPVSDALVAEVLRRAKSYYDTTGNRGGASMYTYTVRSEMPRIGFVPVTSTLRVSPDGWLWVRRPDLEPDPVALEWSTGLPPRPSFWDVFNPDGHFQYTVKFPPRFTLRAVTQNAAIGVLRDELDVEYVVRFGVTPRARS